MKVITENWQYFFDMSFQEAADILKSKCDLQNFNGHKNILNLKTKHFWAT